MPTISVIIPIYNVESYLPECLDSVVSQTYRDLEILLIDDGSQDNCGAICDEYAARDPRIRVVHQPNGGAANAKNAGLRAATGELLSFVDGDDYLEPGAYELMAREMTASGADVIQCSYRDVYQNRRRDRIMVPEQTEWDTTEYLTRFTTDWTCSLLWDKLFRRRLFNGVFFEEGRRIDDEFFTYQGIMNAQKILHLPDIVYNYRKRASSVMQSPETRQQIVLDKLDYLKKRREKVLVRFPELKQTFDLNYVERLYVLSKDTAASSESIKISQRMLRAYFTEGKPCRMKLPFRMELYNLALASPERWLKKHRKPTGMKSEDLVLFE